MALVGLAVVIYIAVESADLGFLLAVVAVMVTATIVEGAFRLADRVSDGRGGST